MSAGIGVDILRVEGHRGFAVVGPIAVVADNLVRLFRPNKVYMRMEIF